MRLIAPLLILLAGPVLACKFIPRTLDENLRDADSVFVGAVERTDGVFQGVKGGTAWLRVLAVHKGTERPGQLVPVSSRMGSCGTEFAKGEQWLVLAAIRESGLETHMPAGTMQLTDDRGLYHRANWEAVRASFRPKELGAAMSDACLRARFALMDFFDRLPRSCVKDADCEIQYLDTHPCYEPVIVDRSRAWEGRRGELLRLQQAERNACPLDAARIPACSPRGFEVACRKGRCERKRY